MSGLSPLLQTTLTTAAATTCGKWLVRANHLVVLQRAERLHRATERLPKIVNDIERRLVRVLARGDDANGVVKKIALRGVDAGLFRTRHRMRADEPGVALQCIGKRGHDGVLHAADIGHDATCPAGKEASVWPAPA